MVTNLNTRFYPWLVWITAACFALFVVLAQTMLAVMIPQFSRLFHLNASGIGLLTAMFFYSYLPLQVPAGILVDRFGPRKVLLVALSAALICFIIFASSTYLITAQLSRFALGIVCAPSIAITLSLAANWFPPQRFGLLVGLTEMMAMFGGVAGQPLLAQSNVFIGWRWSLMIIVLLILLLIVFAFFIVQDQPQQLETEDFVNIQPEKLVIAPLFRMPQVWLAGIFAGMCFSIAAAFGGLWCVPFLRAVYHIAIREAAWGSAMIFIGIAVGGPLIGGLSDRIGRRSPVIMIGSTICFCLLAVVIYVPLNITFIFILLFLLGAASAVYVLPFAIVREITSKRTRGAALAFTNMLCIVFGAPILQPAIGFLLEFFNHGERLPNEFPVHIYHYAFTLLIIGLVVAIVCSVFIKETYCQEQAGYVSLSGK